jgi:hypothetical protein
MVKDLAEFGKPYAVINTSKVSFISRRPLEKR